MMDENLVYFNFFYNQKLLSAFVSTEDFSKNRLFHNIITMEKVSLTPLYMHGGFIYFVMDSMQWKIKPMQIRKTAIQWNLIPFC